MECGYICLLEETDDLRHQIVCDGGPLDEVTNHVNGGEHFAAEYVQNDQAEATLVRTELVAERVREFHALSCDRLSVREVTRHQRPIGLPTENLAQPPVVPCCAGEGCRLGEIRPAQIVIVGMGVAARGEYARQQDWIVELSGNSERFVRLRQGVRDSHP